MRSTVARTARLWPALLILLMLAACRPQGVFRSDQEPAAANGAMTRQAVQVSLEQLDAAPSDYLNRFIRVSGAYTELAETSCAKQRGPARAWALSDGGLRMDAAGFGPILQLVPEGMPLTVDGFWRAYRGPAGCDRESASGVVWYLEAVRLVEPNPLPAIGAVTTEAPGDEEVESAAPETTGTGTPTPDTRTPTATSTSPPTATQAIPSATPDGSATPDLTASPSPTSEPGQPTNTPQPSPTPEPSPTGSSGVTPTSPAPTNTPSGYPGDPGEPPPPTNTPPGY